MRIKADRAAALDERIARDAEATEARERAILIEILELQSRHPEWATGSPTSSVQWLRIRALGYQIPEPRLHALLASSATIGAILEHVGFLLRTPRDQWAKLLPPAEHPDERGALGSEWNRVSGA